jgi:hypothetical protein
VRSRVFAFSAASVVSVGLLLHAPLAARSTPAALSDAEMEQFLLHAKVVKTHSASKGITGSIHATLTDGTLTHDAHIQTIDEDKARYETDQGVEFNFRDTWRFNVAGYRVDRMIRMNMVPVSVERRFGYANAAYTWWVDDVMMEEGDRLKKKLEAPNVEAWNQQMQLVRLFDQLIANVDRNIGNLVITRDWRIYPIDHTRAFRRNHELKSPAQVTRADRAVVEGMKTLDRESLKKSVGKYLTTFELDALLARRDAILKRLDSLGPSALYDRIPWSVSPVSSTTPQ